MTLFLGNYTQVDCQPNLSFYREAQLDLVKYTVQIVSTPHSYLKAVSLGKILGMMMASKMQSKDRREGEEFPVAWVQLVSPLAVMFS